MFLDKDKKGIYFWVFVSVLSVVVWYLVFLYGLNRDFKMYFLDVGQGDAIFIETPDRFQVLIDGGPDNSILSELSSVMPFYDKSIDLLILTHPQKDHIFGLLEVLQRYKVDAVLFSSVGNDNNLFFEFKDIIKRKNIKTIEPKSGLSLNLGKFSKADVLYPFENVSGMEFKNLNDISLALLLKFSDKRFFLSGDAGKKEEMDIVNLGMNLNIDVLKLNHHGSANSNSEIFLNWANPDFFVVSVGRDNTYGHPAEEVLNRLKDKKVLRTDIDGRIKFYTNGEYLKYETEF